MQSENTPKHRLIVRLCERVLWNLIQLTEGLICRWNGHDWVYGHFQGLDSMRCCSICMREESPSDDLGFLLMVTEQMERDRGRAEREPEDDDEELH